MQFTAKELTESAKVSISVIKGLVSQGVILELESPRDLPYAQLDPFFPSQKLTFDQKSAGEILRKNIRLNEYNTTLLRGVTGSGKTEVYLEAVSECLLLGKQALILIPEIALTVEFLDRLKKRFGEKPAQWHSGVTMTEKRRCWRMVAEAKAQVVVGARSSLYLPFKNLGLIVVDEEHDISLSENREYKKGISFYDNTSTLTKRKFCCFLSNYHERYIRGLTACALEKTKLLDQGFVSLKNYGQDFKETLDTSLLTSKHLKAVSTLVNEEFTELEFTATDKVFDMLNMEEILHKSLFNFVIEGSYDKPVNRVYNDVAGAVLHITEKTYRNFIYKKPFIVLGQVGQLKFIRKLGYKTFSPIIDESYDDCTDSSKKILYGYGTNETIMQ